MSLVSDELVKAHIIRFAEARRMPWKNAGGETIEFATSPRQASIGSFDWRVSVATVACDGPFSTFPDVDRVFTVLEGQGLELQVGVDPPITLTQAAEPWSFRGEAPCRCHLIDGPVTALNVMVARKAYRCAVTHTAAICTISESTHVLNLVLCIEGKIETSLGILGRLDGMVIPTETTVQIEPQQVPGRCLMVSIWSA